ncbi:MAG: hypothetical protein ABSD68_04040 [Candidatus Micrarchaeales archaeon]|jgi:hypothetical protein
MSELINNAGPINLSIAKNKYGIKVDEWSITLPVNFRDDKEVKAFTKALKEELRVNTNFKSDGEMRIERTEGFLKTAGVIIKKTGDGLNISCLYVDSFNPGAKRNRVLLDDIVASEALRLKLIQILSPAGIATVDMEKTIHEIAPLASKRVSPSSSRARGG